MNMISCLDAVGLAFLQAFRAFDIGERRGGGEHEVAFFYLVGSNIEGMTQLMGGNVAAT